MRIALIGPYPVDIECIKGGVEASIYGLSLELIKSHQLFIYDIPRYNIKVDKIETIDNLKTFRFFSKSTNNTAALFRLRTINKLILKEKPDICHIHSTSLFSFLIYIITRLYRIPSIVTVHGLMHVEKRKKWLAKRSFTSLTKFIFHSIVEFIYLSICTEIIVDTEYVAESIRSYKKKCKIIHIPKINIIPQGIRPEFFDLTTKSQNYQLLSVGAFTERKGHLNLIKAMKKIQTFFPDFSLTIAGVKSDEQYYHLMLRKIYEHQLEQNIRIVPNATFNDILKFFEYANLFVLHSAEESQGIVFCEAMASGKSIVATNSGGIPFVVQNKINGLLSDYGDIESFANNIITLFIDDNLKKCIEINNRNKSKEYSWVNISYKVIELYSSIK